MFDDFAQAGNVKLIKVSCTLLKGTYSQRQKYLVQIGIYRTEVAHKLFGTEVRLSKHSKFAFGTIVAKAKVLLSCYEI